MEFFIYNILFKLKSAVQCPVSGSKLARKHTLAGTRRRYWQASHLLGKENTSEFAACLTLFHMTSENPCHSWGGGSDIMI